MRGSYKVDDEEADLYGFRRDDGDRSDDLYNDEDDKPKMNRRGRNVRRGGGGGGQGMRAVGIIGCVLVLLLVVLVLTSNTSPKKTDTERDHKVPSIQDEEPAQRSPPKKVNPVAEDSFGRDQPFRTLYGYNGSIETMRREQFPQLELRVDGQPEIYLDYMGAGQYQRTQLEGFTDDITTHLYGNACSLFQSLLTSLLL